MPHSRGGTILAMVRGTLNARRDPDVDPDGDRSCVFTFFEDPGDNPPRSDAPPRRQFCSIEGAEAFLRNRLQLSGDLVAQLCASLRAGENSTIDVELGDGVYGE
jgi:hypothetical protein